MAVLHSLLGILLAADLLIWRQSIRALGRTVHRRLRLGLHGFFILQIASLTALLWGAYTRNWNLPSAVLMVAFIWHLLVAPLALVWLLSGLTAKAIAAFFRLLKRKPATSAPESGGGLSRREFLGTVAALAPPVLTFSLSAYAAARLHDFRIRRLTLPIPSLPPALDGMTIVHLSDLHVGQFTNGPVLKRIVEAANAMKPDLLVFTGDLINNSLSWLPEALETLHGLRPQPVFCEGNHDLIEDRAAFENGVKKAGFRLLLNETVTLSIRDIPVQLLGLRWGAPPMVQNAHGEDAMTASMNELVKLRDPAAFPILLAHHPHAWDHCGDLPLTLAGHTHGGQLMLNERLGAGPVLFRYWTGVYTRPSPSSSGRQTLVVNNGIGNWFPLRTEAPAEIIHLTLVRDDAKGA